MTTTIPLPPGAVHVEQWQLCDDYVSRTFRGTTHEISDVSLAITGQQDYSGELTQIMLTIDLFNRGNLYAADILDVATMRELAAKVLELADEIESLQET
jgi:hypothetical protein